MFMLVLQSFLLIALSYLIGCLLGGFFRRLVAKPEPRYVPLETKNQVETDTTTEVKADTSIEEEVATVEKEVLTEQPTTVETEEGVSIAAIQEASIDVVIDKDKEKKASKADEEGTRPKVLKHALGEKDNLKRIKGVGPKNEAALNGFGIFHFAQIAALTDEEASWIGSFLSFPGRIERENWISQASLLATGKETDFSKRVDKGEVASSMKK